MNILLEIARAMSGRGNIKLRRLLSHTTRSALFSINSRASCFSFVGEHHHLSRLHCLCALDKAISTPKLNANWYGVHRERVRLTHNGNGNFEPERLKVSMCENTDCA